MRGSLYYFGVIILGLSALFLQSTQAQLQLNFYAKSCPKAEKIVKDFVHDHIHNAPSLAAPLIRMHVHDCFVRVINLSLSNIYIHIIFFLLTRNM